MFLLAQLACGPGPLLCGDRLSSAAERVRERWPNAQAALDATYDNGCVWGWSHNRASVDGMGATMVLLSEQPGLDDILHLDLDVYAGGRLDSPSLLFFDQGTGPLDTWPLIGMGYHFDYEPCGRPEASCFAEDDYFVHEAGYHHVVIGGGGMSLATDEDLVRGSSASVDAAGCSDVEDDDVRTRFNTAKHGRAWGLHVWLPSDGAEPIVATSDPEERWNDAPVRLTIDPRAFFVPDDAACACPESANPGDTGTTPPPTCGAAEAPPEEPAGCGAALGLLPLPWLVLAHRRRRRAG